MIIALLAIALAIVFHAIFNKPSLEIEIMPLDQTELNDGLQAVADGLNALAQSIANPPAGADEAQQLLNETGAKLQTFAAQLADMKSAEDTEDAG